jgi:hypothetical protein
MTDKELDTQGYKETVESNVVFHDLIRRTVLKYLDSEEKKTQIYNALCNIVWYNPKQLVQYSCSWRYAGGLVANVEKSKDYLDYYCSDNEGEVESWIEEEFNKENWFPAKYND